jgi:hypothetical protein
MHPPHAHTANAAPVNRVGRPIRDRRHASQVGADETIYGGWRSPSAGQRPTTDQAHQSAGADKSARIMIAGAAAGERRPR